MRPNKRDLAIASLQSSVAYQAKVRQVVRGESSLHEEVLVETDVVYASRLVTPTKNRQNFVDNSRLC